MSVYKPKNSPYFHYDFVHKGRRVYGSTGVATRRDAEKVERRLRQQLADGSLDDAAQMTLNDAAGRWWTEKGERLASASDRERQIGVVIDIIGPKIKLVDIDTACVARAIQKRRQMPYRRGENSAPRLPSDSTVNRDIIDALRPILRRARRAWGAKGLPEIDWGELRLDEPKPKPKELVGGELGDVKAVVAEHWRDMIGFCARYGCRIGEVFFPLSALDIEDPENARVTLRDRKGGDDHVVPLLPDDARMLAARAGRARAAKIDTVWFRVLKKGRLSALHYGGAVKAIGKAMTVTGLRESKGLKGSHDLRRHSAMQVLRATGNLRVTQKLLGHASIQSTLVYAHALEGDVKAAVASVADQAKLIEKPSARRERRRNTVRE